jgi:hypothetical protein
VIITTAAGKIQDNAGGNLDPAVTLWLVYAFLSVAISAFLLFAAQFLRKLLPAAHLSQVRPACIQGEIVRLENALGRNEIDSDGTVMHIGDEVDNKEQLFRERKLKEPVAGSVLSKVMIVTSLAIIVLGWIMFALGVGWGVHGRYAIFGTFVLLLINYFRFIVSLRGLLENDTAS